MARLIDLTLTLGSERVSAIPGLMGVETSPLMTHESHARLQPAAMPRHPHRHPR